MSQQPLHSADPELEILLVEEDIVELQGKVVAAHNDLAAAQKLREESEPGSTSALVAETEIDQICSNIDAYNEEIERLEAERRKLQLQISERLRGR